MALVHMLSSMMAESLSVSSVSTCMVLLSKIMMPFSSVDISL